MTQGVMIPSEDGLLLASQKNPWAEASKWSERIRLNPKRLQVVLGLGAGVHILELARQTDFEIFVVEPRRWLYENFYQLLKHETDFEHIKMRLFLGTSEEVIEKLKNSEGLIRPYQVQEFRPAWGPRTAEFLNLKNELNARLESSAIKMVELDERVGKHLISLKDTKSNQTEFKILRELIK